jgi:signal transduction histidine kinase
MTVVAAADLPHVDGDLRLMERALENLISNALRHTPARVPWKCASAARRRRRSRGGDDTGPWHTGRRATAGVRSPLSRRGGARAATPPAQVWAWRIAKRIVELHGSALRVESEPGKGSCFTFDLPARRDAAASG